MYGDIVGTMGIPFIGKGSLQEARFATFSNIAIIDSTTWVYFYNRHLCNLIHEGESQILAWKIFGRPLAPLVEQEGHYGF